MVSIYPAAQVEQGPAEPHNQEPEDVDDLDASTSSASSQDLPKPSTIIEKIEINVNIHVST